MPRPIDHRAALRQAYLGTDYIVDTTPPFVLIIGEISAGLAALYAARGVDCCAYLTAYNPHSEPLSEATNALRQQALTRDIQTTGLDMIEGRGQHPDGAWPAEPSILVLGMHRDLACELGRKYEQNAIVLADSAARPELIWL